MNSNHQILIAGLGSGDDQQLTLGVYRALKQAEKVYLRTAEHPAVRFLEDEGISYESFDFLYEQHESFDRVYESIASKLIELALNRSEPVVYVVPGHPAVAEFTVKLLKQRCPKYGIELQILGGESFLDQCFIRFGFDPVEGFQVLDAATMTREMLNPSVHTVITQVYDMLTASEVKLTLMELYPDDFPVTVAHSLGIEEEERLIEIPLFELDRQSYGNRSLVWIPKSQDERVLNRTFEQLERIVDTLRSPNGCPWDREQTHQSIRKNLIEETYEVIEAIDDEDLDGMREELGDLLLQVMLHSQMEAEEGTFTVWDVVEGINEKLIRRHPHVFGTQEAENAEEALKNWDAIKREEKRKRGLDPEKISIFSSIPSGLPSIMKAVEIQKKAAKVGFDWQQVEDIFDKINEEMEEFREALNSHQTDQMLAELGDLLFAVVNVARFLKIDPDYALSQTNKKFVDRFSFIEQESKKQGLSLEQMTLDQMEKLWQQAKKY